MPRNPKQKALYEVIKSSQKRLGSVKRAEMTAAGVADSEQSAVKSASEEPAGKAQGPVQTLKPQVLGTRERWQVLLIPYRVALVSALLLVLVVLASFKLGQMTGRRAAEKAAGSVPVESGKIEFSDPAIKQTFKTSPESEVESGMFNDQAPPASAGDNVIVIATYRTRRDLEPVQEYFAGNGIETEIWLRNNYFYLVTKDKFEATESRGSEGYLMKQRIKEIGAYYRAPSGYESFRPNLFQDAYGLKVE
jgi:hypothetical protein